MKTFNLRRIAATALLASAMALPAAAQGAPELSNGRTPGWSFTPGVTVGGVFDSNVALASAPADTRTTQSDTLWTAEPFGSLEFTSPRTLFSAGYHGNLRRYMDLDQLNGFDQRAYGSVRRLATRRLTFFAQDSYSVVPTTDELEVNGVPFSRTGARMNSASGGVDARLTKYTDLSVKYENTWVKFDRADTFLTGGVMNGVRTELAHRINDRASVGAEYGVRLADLNAGTHSISFQDAGGTLHYVVSGRTNATVAAGLSYLNDHLSHETRTGPYVRASLTHDVQRATIGASYERMFVPSFGFGGSNQSQQLRGFVAMPLNKNRMYVQGSAAWRRSDPFVANELRLDTIWLRSTLGYSASRWLRLEGFYAFTRQDSQVTGGEINRQRVGAQVVISQPMRIR